MFAAEDKDDGRETTTGRVPLPVEEAAERDDAPGSTSGDGEAGWLPSLVVDPVEVEVSTGFNPVSLACKSPCCATENADGGVNRPKSEPPPFVAGGGEIEPTGTRSVRLGEIARPDFVVGDEASGAAGVLWER